ncbi:MAG: hypothetical protein MUO78_06575 [candidate division Zixibacteria bacterium]|nr:hypothetical protein [candidate division Zixibacteria bacterium]
MADREIGEKLRRISSLYQSITEIGHFTEFGSDSLAILYGNYELVLTDEKFIARIVALCELYENELMVEAKELMKE